MSHYQVVWSVEVKAGSFKEAAEQAREFYAGSPERAYTVSGPLDDEGAQYESRFIDLDDPETFKEG